MSGSVWIARVSLIAAAMLWSTSFVVLKASLASYHPHAIIFGRMLVASICFVPLFWKYKRTWRLKPGSLKLILFMAFCEPCLYFLAETAALQQTTAAQAGMITAMLPLMVALGAYATLKEEMSISMVAGFVLAIGGAVWLSFSSRVGADAPNPVLGNFLEFLAMVCATGYMISVRHLTTAHGYSPLFITAAQAGLGLIFYLPLILMPSVSFAGPPGVELPVGHLLPRSLHQYGGIRLLQLRHEPYTCRPGSPFRQPHSRFQRLFRMGFPGRALYRIPVFRRGHDPCRDLCQPAAIQGRRSVIVLQGTGLLEERTNGAVERHYWCSDSILDTLPPIRVTM